MPKPSYEAMGPLFEKFFRTLRDPVTGPELMIKQNHFVEVILPSFVNRDLTEAEMAFYRAPFPDEASRKPINMWPNQVPIGGTIDSMKATPFTLSGCSIAYWKPRNEPQSWITRVRFSSPRAPTKPLKYAV